MLRHFHSISSCISHLISYNDYMNKTMTQKYIGAIKRNKSKYVTIDQLSAELGYYSEVIAKDLAEFDPMLMFDSSINVKGLLPKLEEYVRSLEALTKKEPKKKAPIAKNGLSYQEYILSKMTLPGGLIDKNIHLEEAELKALRKLINDELKRIKDSK